MATVFTSLWLFCFLCEGIFAQDSFEDVSQQCTRTIKEGQGSIQSPNFTTSYPNNLHCRWTIEVEQDRTVALTFSYFDVESSTNCQFDRVSIFNGPTTDHPLLGRFCGPFRPGQQASTSNKMLLTMDTDESNNRANKGFIASFISVSPALASLGSCGGLMTSADGSFHSPNYPKFHYPPSITCTWHIKVDINLNIELSFEEFDIESSNRCKYDAVILYAGWSNSDNTKFIDRLCGGIDDVPSTITSPGNELFVTFVSDASGFDKGFSAVYSAKRTINEQTQHASTVQTRPTFSTTTTTTTSATTTTAATTTAAAIKLTTSVASILLTEAGFRCPIGCSSKIKLKSRICTASYIIAVKITDPKSMRTRGASPAQILKAFKFSSLSYISTINVRVACPRCSNMSKGTYLVVGATITEDGIEIRPDDLVMRYKERKHTKQVEKFSKRCRSKQNRSGKKKRRAGSKKRKSQKS